MTADSGTWIMDKHMNEKESNGSGQVEEYRAPDREECMRVLEEYGTPGHVIEHCKAVAAVAFAIGRAFNERRKEMAEEGAGFDFERPLDMDLILASGLLHDMARVSDEHWEVAADYCLGRGWWREAEIIRTHMKYDPFNDPDHFNETDIVCLADRIVLEDRYAGLEPRMDYIVAKAKKQGNDHHVPHILRKKKEVGRLIDDIEEYLGIGLDELMEGLDYERPEGR